MSRLRRHRRWLVPWLAAALLCAQWLTAAYACPQLRAAAQGEAPGVAVSGAVVPAASGLPTLSTPPTISDCGGHGAAVMDPEQPQLCKAHCQAGQQSVNSQASALDAPPAAMLAGALVRALEVHAPLLPHALRADARAAGPPRGAPPLYLSLLVLRN
jgi:hypothetical protein